MTVDGDHLERLWRAAAEQPATTLFRTIEVGVESSRGPLLAAVDRSGRRALLVPIQPTQTLKEDLDGQAVTVRRRALEDETSYNVYACLELIDEQNGLFTLLCVEVIERVAACPERAVAMLKKALSDWRALLAGARESLSESALLGLFGELCVLRELLESDPGAVTFWTGPQGAAQDFHRGRDAIEVKTTSQPEGRRVRINGVTQLDLQTPGRLVLRWFRIEKGRGISVPALVDQINDLTDDPIEFRKLLGEVGYRESGVEGYAGQLFEIVEQRAYEVGSGFPRVVAGKFLGGAVPAGVDDIDYIVDLDSASAVADRLDEESLIAFMGNS
ncbi:PD-(D/E)XK motif protein [Rhodococcus sp. ACT016]|uniref:PD-(D/E)XK motif protein n=1 Tax=Rhodococcus sp. ACT016 TaxID=3134808 RepID=UPI003D2DFACE